MLTYFHDFLSFTILLRKPLLNVRLFVHPPWEVENFAGTPNKNHWVR